MFPPGFHRLSSRKDLSKTRELIALAVSFPAAISRAACPKTLLGLIFRGEISSSLQSAARGRVVLNMNGRVIKPGTKFVYLCDI